MGESTGIDVTPLVVVVNAALVALVLMVAGWFLGARPLTPGVPRGRQVVGEFILDFFVRKARDMAHGLDRGHVVRAVAPFLGTCFLVIVVSNLFGMMPLPIVNRPPTSYFSVTLGLALCSVAGTLLLSARFKGGLGAAKHLFWPNPMQWISEFTDVASLSLRLFGNIGGEYMTLVLVVAVVPYGIPLILHVLGLIPAFVQALVFTLLTASFLESAIHGEKRRGARAAAGGEAPSANAA